MGFNSENFNYLGYEAITSSANVDGIFTNRQVQRNKDVWAMPKKVISVSGNGGSGTEQSTFNVGVSTEGFEDGDQLNYTIYGINGAAVTNSDFVQPSSMSGSLTVNNNSTNIVIQPNWENDNTELVEGFKIELRRPSDNFLLFTSEDFTITNVYLDVYTLAGSYEEGQTLSINVTSNNILAGTYFWEIQAVSGTLSVTDFSEYRGSVTLSADQNTEIASPTILSDGFDENGGTETFKIVLKDSNDNIVEETASFTVNDGSVSGVEETKGVSADISALVDEMVANNYMSTDTTEIVAAIEAKGYKVIMIPGHLRVSELMVGTDVEPLNTRGQFSYAAFDRSNSLELTNGFSNAALNGYPYIGFLGFESSLKPCAGGAIMAYKDYGAGTQLKNLYYPNQDRNLYTYVYNADGSEIENVSAGTSTMYSSGQNPTVNGYYSTSKFSNDDGSFGFINGITALDGNGGPYLRDNTSNAYGCENPNSADSSATNFYWGSSVQSSAFWFYAFIKEL